MNFDPYYVWLRIPAGPRPPNHYALLGLPKFECDEFKIQAAALDRLALLRKHQAGQHPDECQRLMNEVAAARLCLTDSLRKGQYDLELQVHLDRESTTANHARPALGWLPAIAAVVLLAGLGSVAAVYFSRPNIEPPTTPEKTSVADSSPEPTPAPAPEPIVDSAAPKLAETKPPSETKELPKPKTAPQPAPVALGYRTTAKFLAPSPAEATSFAEDDVVRRVGPFLGPKDELAPVAVFADGHWLAYFGGEAPGKMLWATRADRKNLFLEVGEIGGLPNGAGSRGMTVAADGLHCWFAGGTSTSLMTAKRHTLTEPWSAVAPIASVDGPLQGDWPAVAKDGLELYFVAKTSDGPTVVFAERDAVDEPFGKPVRLGFPRGFTEPSVSADGQTLCLTGPTAAGPTAIYRARRESESKWSKPEPLREIRGFAGERPAHDRTPAMTADGSRLYFASDRDGGAGGFDLWTVKAPKYDEPVDLIAMAKKNQAEPKASPTKAKGKAKAKPAASEDDAISKPKPAAPPKPNAADDDDWFVLGPLPLDATPTHVNDLLELGAETALRKFPKANDRLLLYDLRWRNAGQVESKGVYLFAAWLRTDKSAHVRMAVTNAPGGGVAWLDERKHELSWRVGELQRPLVGELRTSEPFRLSAGRHRLVATVVVERREVPFVVKLQRLGADDAPEPADAAPVILDSSKRAPR